MNDVHDKHGMIALETKHAEYDLDAYGYIIVGSDSICVGWEYSSEEFDALLIISAKDLRLAGLDERIQRFVENFHVHAVKALFFSCLSLNKFVQC